MNRWDLPQAGQRPSRPRPMAVVIGGCGQGFVSADRSGCQRGGVIIRSFTGVRLRSPRQATLQARIGLAALQYHIGSLDPRRQGRKNVRMARILVINPNASDACSAGIAAGDRAVSLPRRPGRGRRHAERRAAGDLYLAGLAFGGGADVPAGGADRRRRLRHRLCVRSGHRGGAYGHRQAGLRYFPLGRRRGGRPRRAVWGDRVGGVLEGPASQPRCARWGWKTAWPARSR